MESPKAVHDSLYPIRIALLQRKQQMDEKKRKEQIEPRENLAGELAMGSGSLIKAVFLGNDELKLKYLVSKQSTSATAITTIGTGFEAVDVGNDNKIQMWDTAGQSRFREITAAYIRGAQIMFVFAKDQTDFDNYRNQLKNNTTVLNNSILMILVKPGNQDIEFEPLPFTSVLEIDGQFNLQQLAESSFKAIKQYAESIPGLFERIKAARQAQDEENARTIQLVKNFLNDRQFWNKNTGSIFKSFPDTITSMQKLFENNKTPTLNDLKLLVKTKIQEFETAGKSSSKDTTFAFYKCVHEATNFKSISAWILTRKDELSPPTTQSTPAPTSKK